MKPCRKLYEAEKFDTIKEYINNSIKKYAKNTAFILKHKNGKNVKYENISYEQFGKDILHLGTGLIEIGLENKSIAIIALKPLNVPLKVPDIPLRLL